MPRGRKPSTELDDLNAGLAEAEDPYQIKELLEKPLQELADEVRKEIRYSAVSMIRAGRIFMAIKKKLEHGNWEEFVIAQRWNWEYVRASMKLLEVTARFPQAVHLPPGRVTNKIYHLPMPQIHQIFAELPDEAVKKLTPWDLERIYHEKRAVNIKAKRKPKPPPAESVELPTELDALASRALSALRLIAEYKIDSREAARAKRYAKEIESAWNRAAYNLQDPEHKKKPWWETHPADEFADQR